MKGIETQYDAPVGEGEEVRSDHCPAMKGIETARLRRGGAEMQTEATTAPQ